MTTLMLITAEGEQLPFDTLAAELGNTCDLCQYKGLLYIVNTQSIICANCLIDMPEADRNDLIERARIVRPKLTVAGTTLPCPGTTNISVVLYTADDRVIYFVATKVAGKWVHSETEYPDGDEPYFGDGETTSAVFSGGTLPDVVISGDEWRDLENYSGRLDEFMDLYAAGSIAAAKRFASA